MDFGYNYNYEYDYPISYGNTGSSLFALFMTVYLVVIALILAAALASYIFHSIGMYTIGKRIGREHPWLAFIPFARDYFHGELAGEIPLKNKSIKNPGIWKLVVPIIYNAVAGVLLVFLIVAVIGTAVTTNINGSGVGGAMTVLTTSLGIYIIFIILAVAYSAIYSVLRILIDIRIYERFTTHNMAVVHSVLSAIVPLYEAICFFVMRNREFNPGMEPRITPPPVPPVYPGDPVSGGPTPVNQVPADPAQDTMTGQQDNKTE